MIERQANVKQVKAPTSKQKSKVGGRPNAWLLWLKILVFHYSTCRLPPGACPVLLCRKARLVVLQEESLVVLKEKYEKRVAEEMKKAEEAAAVEAAKTAIAAKSRRAKAAAAAAAESEALVITKADEAGPGAGPGPASGGSLASTISTQLTGVPASSAAGPGAEESAKAEDGTVTSTVTNETSGPAIPPWAVMGLEEMLTAHYLTLFRVATKSKEDDEDEDDEVISLGSAGSQKKQPTVGFNMGNLVEVPKAMRDYMKEKGQLLRQVDNPVPFKEAMAEAEGLSSALILKLADQPIAEVCKPKPIVKKAKKKNEPSGAATGVVDSRIVTPLPPDRVEFYLRTDDFVLLMGEMGRDARGRTVKTTWDVLRQRKFEGGLDLFTWTIRRLTLPQSLEGIDHHGAMPLTVPPTDVHSALHGRDIVFDRTHDQRMVRLGGVCLLVKATLPSEGQGTGLVLRAYDNSTSLWTSLFLDIDDLSRIIPSHIMSGAVSPPGEDDGVYAPEGSLRMVLTNLPVLAAYVMAHLSHLVTVRRVGHRVLLALKEDVEAAASVRRRRIEDAYRKRNVSQAAASFLTNEPGHTLSKSQSPVEFPEGN
jgi:hypothetical protein